MSSPLALEQLLNNKKSSSSSSFILLNDTIKFSSLPIIIDIGKRALDQEEEKTLIVLLTEISPALWREQFSAYKRNKIYIIDAYSNPLGWNEADSTDKNVLQVNDIKNMEKSILSPIIKKAMETPNCTILIDSVTPLALISQYRTYQLVKTLESLTTDAIRLIIGFHSDLKLTLTNGLNLNDSFNRLASAIIKLEPLKERTHFETQVALTGFIPQDIFSYTTITSNNITKGGIAHIEWRKKSGKVIYESNGFILNEKTQLLDVVPTSQLIGEEIKEEEDKEKELESEIKAMKIDPTANLSFNLSLTDEQRKQKENLVLPYLKAQQLEVSIDNEDNSGKKANNGGLIYYDPDAADDFDDEDPDEDLDI